MGRYNKTRDCRSEGRTSYRLYRAGDGMALGVCKGLADYLDISAGLVRIVFLVLLFATDFLPAMAVYVLAGLLLPKAPPAATEAFSPRAETLRDIRDTMERLDGRIRRMEDAVTRSSFDWEERLRRH